MKIIDLTHTINENTLNFRGNPGCCFRTIWDYEQCTTQTKFKVQYIDISAGLGTHIDSPSHCFPNSNTVADIAEEIIYDTIIFDFVEFCQTNYSITLDMIIKKISNDQISLNNKFIIIKTGWGIKWGAKEYFNNYHCPHITKEAGEYFAKNQIAGLGIDTLSPDLISNDGYFPVHEILLSKNIFIIENIANLDKISTNILQCIIAPLKITSTESPIRLCAIVS